MPIGPWELAIILFILGGPLLLGILFAVYLVIRARSVKDSPANRETALEILQKRYARGEIDADEYEERRQRLHDENL